MICNIIFVSIKTEVLCLRIDYPWKIRYKIINKIHSNAKADHKTLDASISKYTECNHSTWIYKLFITTYIFINILFL